MSQELETLIKKENYNWLITLYEKYSEELNPVPNGYYSISSKGNHKFEVNFYHEFDGDLYGDPSALVRLNPNEKEAYVEDYTNVFILNCDELAENQLDKHLNELLYKMVSALEKQQLTKPKQVYN